MWNVESAQRFGKTVRRLRNERDLSQEALAYRSGISKNQLQLIEAGRNSAAVGSDGPSNPRMSTIVGLASVLEVTAAELLADAEL